MRFSIESLIMEKEISELFEGYRYLPFREYGLDKTKLERYAAKKLTERIAQKKAKAVAIRGEKDELLGVLTYSKLEWDSVHFGMPMAAITDIVVSENISDIRENKKKAIQVVLSDLEKDGIVHVSAKADIFDVATAHALEAAGFRLMDTTVIYGFDFRKSQIPDFEDQCKLRMATLKDEDALLRVAAISFSETRISEDRFHSDPDLPKEKSDALYVEWIRNSVRGKIADAIVVAEIDGKPVGFTTLENFRAKADEVGVNIGALILSAVLPEARGRNAYTSMIRNGLQYFRTRVDIAELGTQITNFPVQKAWSRLGFKLASGTYAFHRKL